MSAFIVGLTGGIASGKSELSRRFEALGIVVVDADVIARQVVAPGPVLQRIVEQFGPDVLQSDGTLDRRALRARVFANPQQRGALEAITHPAIRRELRQAAEAAGSPYAVAAIPLLTEAGGHSTYPWLDRILVVDTPVDVQRMRLMRRDGIDAELAEQMIGAQASRAQRLALADDVVVNDADPAQMDRHVAALDARYRALAAAKNG